MKKSLIVLVNDKNKVSPSTVEESKSNKDHTSCENDKDTKVVEENGPLKASPDRSSSLFDRTDGTVKGATEAVDSFDFAGKISLDTIRLNGSWAKKALAFSGATVATPEVCFNAMLDVVLSRSKLGNRLASCGGKEVTYLNIVTPNATCVVSKKLFPLEDRT